MNNRKLFDRELLDALDSLSVINFTGTLWRTNSPNRDPLLGGSGGGRWSEPNGAETLYASLEADVSISELYYHLSNAPVFSSSKVQLCEIQAIDLSVLNLNDIPLLQSLGIDDPMAKGPQYLEQTRAVGSTAEFLEYHGIIVPSVRSDGQNLVLFPGRLDLNESLSVIEIQDINWPAWIENNNQKKGAE